MKKERCPHCGEAGFLVGKLPKEVVAVMACRHCDEISVVFRKKIIPLNKSILESGSFEERKEHLAEVIAQFLEAGLFTFDATLSPNEEGEYEAPPTQPPPRRRRRRPAKESGTDSMPITDQEMDRFVRIDLKCIDNPTYFKRIFG